MSSQWWSPSNSSSIRFSFASNPKNFIVGYDSTWYCLHKLWIFFRNPNTQCKLLPCKLGNRHTQTLRIGWPWFWRHIGCEAGNFYMEDTTGHWNHKTIPHRHLLEFYGFLVSLDRHYLIQFLVQTSWYQDEWFLHDKLHIDLDVSPKTLKMMVLPKSTTLVQIKLCKWYEIIEILPSILLSKRWNRSQISQASSQIISTIRSFFWR